MTKPLLLGAVAYDTKVVTIWDGFRRWFAEQNFPFDYILYSNYERQVEELSDGHIDVAWNSPLAWVRAHRMHPTARAVAMRDTDRDLTSVVVVRNSSNVSRIADLSGKVVATGAVDSPQATLLPLALLHDCNFNLRRFDVGVGLHGDHVGGERDAAKALVSGDVDAACMLDASHILFGQEGIFPPGETRIIATTEPYDHCNMTTIDSNSARVEQFASLLIGMDYGDPVVRPLLQLEGLTKWLPGRDSGYQQLEHAVDSSNFYSDRGEITADDYRPHG